MIYIKNNLRYKTGKNRPQDDEISLVSERSVKETQTHTKRFTAPLNFEIFHPVFSLSNFKP